MGNEISIGLVENDESFQTRIIALLKDVPALESAEIFAWSSAEAFWRDEKGRNLDLIFLDIMLPNMSGVDLAGHLTTRDPQTPVVMLTNMNSDDLIFRSLRSGAVGYILKSELDDLPNIVDATLRGGAIITPTIAFRVLRGFKNKTPDTGETPQLTPRERNILDHMVCGRTAARVAELLGISSFTVQDHVKHIYKKLNVHNRAEMVRRASELDLF